MVALVKTRRIAAESSLCCRRHAAFMLVAVCCKVRL